jgi:CheY-like chemotaxis protein
MRVLIVEDEKPLRDSIVEQLQQHGFNVDAAADGEEGLYCAREYALDLAIVDLGLPKLNGMELIKKLRAEGKSYPVLILTARDKWQDKVEGLQAGADDYLAKPFHFEELLARMQALLRRSGGWAQPVLRCGAVALDPRTQEVTVHFPTLGPGSIANPCARYSSTLSCQRSLREMCRNGRIARIPVLPILPSRNSSSSNFSRVRSPAGRSMPFSRISNMPLARIASSV